MQISLHQARLVSVQWDMGLGGGEVGRSLVDGDCFIRKWEVMGLILHNLVIHRRLGPL